MNVRDRLHWIDGPEDEGESTNRNVEGLGLAILTLGSSAAVEGKLVDDDNVGNASVCVPAPLLTITSTVGSEETSEDHDNVGDNSNENVGTAETSQEAEIEEQEWGGDTPINVTGIIDLAVDVLNSIWDMLVLFDELDVVQRDAIT